MRRVHTGNGPRTRPRAFASALTLLSALGFACASAACSGACSADDKAEHRDKGKTSPIEAGPMLPQPAPLVHDPAPEPSLGPTAPPVKNNRFQLLTLQRGSRQDCVELRPARPGDNPKDPSFRPWNPGSEGIGVAAIGFFHPAFAKAHRGFDLTAPRLLAPAELVVLANELTEIGLALLAAPDLAAAKSRWGKTPLVAELERDEDWRAARPVLEESARGLATRARAHAAAKEGLWVLAF